MRRGLTLTDRPSRGGPSRSASEGLDRAGGLAVGRGDRLLDLHAGVAELEDLDLPKQLLALQHLRTRLVLVDHELGRDGAADLHLVGEVEVLHLAVGQVDSSVEQVSRRVADIDTADVPAGAELRMRWRREPHTSGAPVTARPGLDNRLRPRRADDGVGARNGCPPRNAGSADTAGVAVLVGELDAVVEAKRLGCAVTGRHVEVADHLTGADIGVRVLDRLGVGCLAHLDSHWDVSPVTVRRARSGVRRTTSLLLEGGVAAAGLVVLRPDQPLPRTGRGKGDAGLP